MYSYNLGNDYLYRDFMGKESSSITGTFGKIGRRLLLTAFVSAVALSTDAQPAFQADSAKTDTASLPPPGKAAEHNYLRMFQAVSNGYSARLDSLEEYLTGYLQRNDTSVHKGVIIMDPLKFDVARALGYTTKEAVVMLLEEKGALYKTVTNMGAVAENMELSFSSQYGDMTYTQSPISIVNLYNISQPSRIAVIIPMPQHAMPFNVPGMKNDVLLEYIDRHEGWHVLDVLTSFIGIDASYMNSDSSRLVFSNGALLRSSHAREFASRKLKQESLADVGALGDMIHAGHGPAIIEQVMRWREKSAAVDGWHMTAPALERLQKKLAETGLEEFKKMNEKERRDFYMDIVENPVPRPRA
jgi:hypothetical protein